MKILKQSTSAVIAFGPFVSPSDGATLVTTLVSAIDHASTGIFLSKAGGAGAVRHATVTASTYDSYGMYLVTLDATDTGTLGRLRVMFAAAASCLPVWDDFMVVPANIYDSLVAGSDVLDVSVTQFGGSNLTQAAGIPEVKVNNIAANAITATSIAADAITAAKVADGTIDAATFAASAINAAAIAADAITAAKIADGAIDAATFAAGAINAAAIAADAITAAKLADGAIDAATFAAGAINAAAIAADAITDAKVASDVTIASVTGAVGSVTGAVGSVTGNVGGNVAGSVGSVAAGGISTSSFAAGAIDAAAIAADAIGASELAASAVAEIQSGLSTLDAAAVRAAVGLASANLDTQLDALPTAAENATAVASAVTSDHGAGSYVRNTEPLDAAATRGAVGLASANLDTQLDALPTNAELATALAAADDAVLAAIAALNNLSQANVRTAIGLGSANLDTQLGAIAAYIDTEVAAIKAKTDNLPSDPADASDIAASFSSIASTLSTIAGYIDTEVAAIKAKTDNLPAAPAATSDIPTALQNADALLKRDMSAVTGEAARSPINALRFLRNKVAIVGSTITIYEEDDVTPAWTGTIATASRDALASLDPS